MGTEGIRSELRRSSNRTAMHDRMPDRPTSNVLRRMTIIARTSSCRISGPRPTAWDRMRLSCKSSNRSEGMAFEASEPNPVLIPYHDLTPTDVLLEHVSNRIESSNGIFIDLDGSAL